MSLAELKRLSVRALIAALYVFCCSVLPVNASLQCNGCHGTPGTLGDIRPLDSAFRSISTGGFPGNHRTHLTKDAVQSSCTACHPGSDTYGSAHRDGLIKLAANINSSPTGALYKNYTTSFKNWTSPFPQTPEPRFGACTNVNCHFEQTTPIWGGQYLTIPDGCRACHGLPPTTGSHVGHFAKLSTSINGSITNTCGKCHFDYSVALNPFLHATSAGKRPPSVNFQAAPNNGGSYSGSSHVGFYLPSQDPPHDGTCSNLYCHSDGSNTNQYKSPQWGGSLPNGCTECHGSTVTSGTPIGTNAHGKHISSYVYACERCHADTVDYIPSIKTPALHVNNLKDVALKDGGNYQLATKQCTNTYCHSDARGKDATVTPVWSSSTPMVCDSCHRGTRDNFRTMSSAGHDRLVGKAWIRHYPCYYCHSSSVNTANEITDKTKHANKVKDVVIDAKWRILNRPFPSYSSATKTCYNVYCHSDGTKNPTDVKPYIWSQGRTDCNSCHGHSVNTCSNAACHDGTIHDGRFWPVYTRWSSGQEWRAAVPMFKNEGPGLPRANSHPRHVQTNFTCDKCHSQTIVNGDCRSCHEGGLPAGRMGEVAHINADFHVDTIRQISFSDGGTYVESSKTCTNTKCHSGTVIPKWGDTTSGSVICLGCHGNSGSNGGDLDTFAGFGNGTQARISTDQWVTTGHGRYSTSGHYPGSNNPAANFPANPCWYCHDNAVLHADSKNPFRLRKHYQYEQRFDKECVYCHMEYKDYECINCHVGQTESLAPQATIGGIVRKLRGGGTSTKWTNHSYLTSCISVSCHDSDDGTFSSGVHKGHSTGAGVWNVSQKADIKSQYVMMGVCLQCHDDDTSNQCTFCHSNTSGKYTLGFDPGTGFIKPKKARASASHFGKKHWGAYQSQGIWKGGKFCWDCHDPHGDGNIYDSGSSGDQN